MRDDWPVSHLGEAVELGKGGSWGADSPAPGLKEAFCLRGTDLAELINGKRPDAPRRWLKQSELSKSQCKPDMVLIETSGSKCGRSLVLTTEMLAQFELPVVYSNFCRTLKIDTSKLSSSYAELWFSHNYWNGVIPSYRATSAMPNLDVKSLLRMETLLIPPLEVQQRIVDLASSVDSYIAALQQQADAARVARSAVLSELLSAGGDDWAETTLGKVAHWQGGITPSMANRSFWEGGTIPWISSGDVLQLSQYGAGKYVTEATLRETSLKLLPIGTIVVVVRSGILAHTLPVALLDTPSTINQDIKAGLPQSGVLGEFLMWFLRSNSQSILESCRKTGTTVQSVSTDAFLRFQVSLPPTKEQERIVAIVSSMEEVIKSADKVVADAKSLRSGLLSDLLSGSHEIPESYDRLLGAA